MWRFFILTSIYNKMFELHRLFILHTGQWGERMYEIKRRLPLFRTLTKIHDHLTLLLHHFPVLGLLHVQNCLADYGRGTVPTRYRAHPSPSYQQSLGSGRSLEWGGNEGGRGESGGKGGREVESVEGVVLNQGPIYSRKSQRRNKGKPFFAYSNTLHCTRVL